MISVAEAQKRLLALASPLPSQTVPLDQAAGRCLAADVIARRSQPAADLSAMDGYALRFADLPGPIDIIGESAAGRPFSGEIGSKQAARIFTGAHVPESGDTILIQEDAIVEGTRLFLNGAGPDAKGMHIRPAGADFRVDDVLLKQGTLLTAGAIAAAAMGGLSELAVGGSPKIRIFASGDELLPPGEVCDAAHIPSSNNVMLAAMLGSLPCAVHDAGIVADDMSKLTAAFAASTDYDILVISGGASVGDHDLVQSALKKAGAEIDFWRVAMRPGKPMMAGRIGKTMVLGLPGNPSSAFVTAFLFVLPLVRHMSGSEQPLPMVRTARVSVALPEGNTRAEYLRAYIERNEITPFSKQDSGMVRPLSMANALLIRETNALPLEPGDQVLYLPI